MPSPARAGLAASDRTPERTRRHRDHGSPRGGSGRPGGPREATAEAGREHRAAAAAPDHAGLPVPLGSELRANVDQGREGRRRQCGGVGAPDRAAVPRAARGLLRVLAERVAASAPPVALTPPPAEEAKGSPVEGECLFCGVPAVAMAAQRVVARGGVEQARAEAWTPTSADATVLGGRTSGRLRGHLCFDCADSKEAVGSVGAGAIERAYERHMRATGRATICPRSDPTSACRGSVRGPGPLEPRTASFGSTSVPRSGHDASPLVTSRISARHRGPRRFRRSLCTEGPGGGARGGEAPSTGGAGG